MTKQRESSTRPWRLAGVAGLTWRRIAGAALLTLCCLSGPSHAQPPAAPSLGFVGLEVAEIEAAMKFYIDGVGMKQALVLSKPTDPFQKIGLNFTGDPRSAGPLLILIHYDKPKAAPSGAPPGVLVGVLVPDTHAAAARLRSRGYQVLREPAATDKGPILTSIARDPDGRTVELSEIRGVPPT